MSFYHLPPGRCNSVAALRHPCDGKVNRGGKAPMTRVGLVACCNYRSRSSSPRRPHSQPDPVLNTIIVLFYNVINTIKILKKILGSLIYNYRLKEVFRCREDLHTPGLSSCVCVHMIFVVPFMSFASLCTRTHIIRKYFREI